jgi:hypothetical protein
LYHTPSAFQITFEYIAQNLRYRLDSIFFSVIKSLSSRKSFFWSSG